VHSLISQVNHPLIYGMVYAQHLERTTVK